jgi:hypothetical protein
MSECTVFRCMSAAWGADDVCDGCLIETLQNGVVKANADARQ